MADSSTTRKSKHYRSWHLANTTHDALTTEFEWAVLRFQQAFERWVLSLSSISGAEELSFQDAVILHVIGMQDRPKSAAEIARQLNRDDIPNIQYCIRKLVKQRLCRESRTRKNGSSKNYELTKRGNDVASDYAKLREEILTSQTNSIDHVDDRMRDSVQLISLFTGLYDEASRIAASYSAAND